MHISFLELFIPIIGILVGWFAVSLGDQPVGLVIWGLYLLLLISVSKPLAQWISGEIDAFDPLGLLALFAVHFFGVTPMYQYASASYPYLQWDSVTNGWVVYWFAVNSILMSAFFFVLTKKSSGIVFLSRERLNCEQPVATALYEKAIAYKIRGVAIFLLVIAVALKALILAKFGGLGGIMSAYQDRLEQGVTQYNPLAGLGALVYLSDAAPVLASIVIVLTCVIIKPVRYSAWGGWMLAIGIPVSFLYVGLVGSRSNTVYTAFILLCYASMFWRKLRAINIIIGGVLMVIFMNSYLAYKFGGIEAVFDENAKKAAFAARQLENPLEFLLIRDFGRMDVQVLAMREMFDEDYPPAWGRSYIGGVFSIVPSAIFPGRPENFTLEKTEIVFPGMTLNGEKATTLVFGGAGEAWVNWKWLAPLVIIPYYFVVVLCVFYFRYGALGGWNKFLCPVYSLVPIALLVYDSNSMLYFLAQFALCPLIISLKIKKHPFFCNSW
mgnify:CR=1 FL=1